MSMSSDMNMGSVEDQSVDGPHTDTQTMDNSASMPAGMDMTPGHNDGVAGTFTRLDARQGHSMAMSLQPESLPETLMRTVEPEMGARATLNHSGTLSPCMHELCSQTSMSVSPPTGDHSQLSSLRGMPLGISNSLNIWTTFHWIRPGTPPPKILAVDRLTTPLRI